MERGARLKAYIITCNDKISSLGFDDFDKAEKWIMSREYEEKPKKWNGWTYLAGRLTYKIYEVNIE